MHVKTKQFYRQKSDFLLKKFFMILNNVDCIFVSVLKCYAAKSTAFIYKWQKRIVFKIPLVSE